MVGIWGLGGGGKTTLASSLYHDISRKFDGCCFVENIREESNRYGVKKLQEKMLSQVLKQKQMKVNRVEEGICLIKSRFCSKKVLLVLDDVDHLDQLKALAGSYDWFGEGSRIIITTRDNHLLNAHKVSVIYNISLLNNDEAMKLFCKHAPRHCRMIQDYEMLLKDVISYAGGLPLALKVMGSFLCDKDKSEWMNALARLKDIPDIDIVGKLKISYDGLKPMEKELFLDIACFFRGEEKDEAMVILDACGFYPIIGVKVLIQKALISVSRGRFDMHDLVQEMGHYIVRGENPKSIEKYSRVWQMEDVLNICNTDATSENDRIEALQIGWHLKYLPSILPQVVANMKKLRWVSCVRYPTMPFSRKFQPTKLCCLTLKNSSQQQLWKGYKHLPNLKVIDLSYSSLVTTPDLDGLPCLERIILISCSSLTTIHPSIGYHERLIFVNMEHCRSLKMFPPIIRMKKLETLLLSHCRQLCKFPEIQMNMETLVDLRLTRTMIEIVPASIGHYCTNLLSLDLRNCVRLKSIEGNFRLLKHLKGLHLLDCHQLKIPTKGLFDAECCLQVLSLPHISFNDSMKYRRLVKKSHQRPMNMKLFGFTRLLRRLSLRSCNFTDRAVSFVLCELSNLEVLDLSRNNFLRLPSSLSKLPRLKLLDLSRCVNLVELPNLPSSIAILKAEWCLSLQIVDDLSTNYKWLWKFSFSTKPIVSDGERVLQSMLQGNALEDYFISLCFDGTSHISTRDFERRTFILQLPLNWYNEFSGFVIYVKELWGNDHLIVIKDVMDMDYEDDVLEAFPKINPKGGMCYISFGSLRQTSWWNSTHDTISFFTKDLYLRAELIPRRNKDDSTQIAKDSTNCSEFWDDETKDRKTFEIKHDSKSSIEILWRRHHEDIFNHI